MLISSRLAGAAPAVALLCVLALPGDASAQGRGKGAGGKVFVSLSMETSARIRQFYSSHPAGPPAALPPGIRRNLERGKPLPPGIAKKGPPAALLSSIRLPQGFELMEAGVDVLLVETATAVIHDVLHDLIR